MLRTLPVSLIILYIQLYLIVFITYFHFYIAPSRYQGPDPDRFHQSLKKADKGLSSTTLNDGTLPRDRHSSHSIFIIAIITKTYQDQSFADVPISDAGVDTVQFLLASEGLVGLFGKYLFSPFYTERLHISFPDLFGSAAFTVVQNDLRGNIVVRVGINQLLQSLITSPSESKSSL